MTIIPRPDTVYTQPLLREITHTTRGVDQYDLIFLGYAMSPTTNDYFRRKTST